MDSVVAPDGSKGDRILGSSIIHFVGSVLAARFFSQWMAQNISQ